MEVCRPRASVTAPVWLPVVEQRPKEERKYVRRDREREPLSAGRSERDQESESRGGGLEAHAHQRVSDRRVECTIGGKPRTVERGAVVHNELP